MFLHLIPLASGLTCVFPLCIYRPIVPTTGCASDATKRARTPSSSSPSVNLLVNPIMLSLQVATSSTSNDYNDTYLRYDMELDLGATRIHSLSSDLRWLECSNFLVSGRSGLGRNSNTPLDLTPSPPSLVVFLNTVPSTSGLRGTRSTQRAATDYVTAGLDHWCMMESSLGRETGTSGVETEVVALDTAHPPYLEEDENVKICFSKRRLARSTVTTSHRTGFTKERTPYFWDVTAGLGAPVHDGVEFGRGSLVAAAHQSCHEVDENAK
ncbi:hypothetical protein BDQ17DRAFT_1338477 [Cyathus striatus]|nr:hypothetical protein BDQ17DRAFT_1338477 [Cyathus striatus]